MTVLQLAGDWWRSNNAADARAVADVIDPAHPVVFLGDCAYDTFTTGEAAGFKTDVIDRIPVNETSRLETVPVIGNHDSPNLGVWDNFWQLGGDEYYTLTFGDIQVIALNSEDGGSPGIGGTQLAWLQGILATPHQGLRIACMHHPLRSSSTRVNPNTYNNNTQLKPAFDALYAGGVDLVFVAHVHVYERTKKVDSDFNPAADGFRQIMAGTGGNGHVQSFELSSGTLMQAPNGSGDVVEAQVTGNQANPNGFVRLTYNSGSDYTLEYVDRVGAVRDSITEPVNNHTPQPVGTAANIATWNLTFEDNFEGTSVDAAKWETGWFGTGITESVNGLEDAGYDDNQLSVSGGNLAITVDVNTNPAVVLKGTSTQAPYVGGLINTRNTFSFTYGYAEARILVPDNGARLRNWAAFWTNGYHVPGGHPQDGEIDIMETLDTGLPAINYHHPGGSNGADINLTTLGGWHVYAAHWEPGKVDYYYDGVLVATRTAGIQDAPHYLIVDYTVNDEWDAAAPETMQVDYVRVWETTITTPPSTPDVRETGLPTSSNGASSFHLAWLGTGNADLTEIAVTLTVTDTPTQTALYYWAMSTDFYEAGVRQGSGHTGLQYINGYPNLHAVNWGGYDAIGDVEWSGSTSALPSAQNNPNTRDFDWAPGVSYRFRIYSPSAGLWRSEVTNLATNATTVIRDLFISASSMRGPQVWSEVFADCGAEQTSVQWSDLTYTVGSVTATPTGVSTNYQTFDDGGCTNTNSFAVSTTTVEQRTSVQRVTPAATVIPLAAPSTQPGGGGPLPVFDEGPIDPLLTPTLRETLGHGPVVAQVLEKGGRGQPIALPEVTGFFTREYRDTSVAEVVIPVGGRAYNSTLR